MKITISMVSDFLTKWQTKTHIQADKEIIQAVQLWDPTSTIEPYVLYIVQNNLALEVLPLEIKNVLYIAATHSIDPTLSRIQNIIYLYADISGAECYSFIQDWIMQLHYWSDSLLYQSLENRGLQSMIDHAEQLLQNPILIFDTSFKILGYSQNLYRNSDDVFDEGLRNQYIALTDAQFQEMKYFHQSASQKSEPEIFQFEQLTNRFLHINITFNQKHFAFFEMIEQHSSITTGQIHIAEYICHLIAIELQKREVSTFDKNKMYEYLFKDIITNINLSQTELRKRFLYLTSDWKKYLFALAICPISDSTYSVYDCIEKLPYFMQKYTHFVHDSSVIVIIDSISTVAFTHYELEQIHSFLSKVHANAGISDAFQDITAFRNAYDQVTRIVKLSLANHQYQLLHYKDYRLNDLIEQISIIEGIENYYYPPLTKLIKHDQKHQSELGKTLLVYIQNHLNQKLTATLLNIHRSTLIYRLHKIEDILEQPLEDHRVLFHIQFTFMLMDVDSKSSLSSK